MLRALDSACFGFILPHGFVTLGKRLNLSVLRFPYLQNGCKDSTYLRCGIVWRTDERIIGEGVWSSGKAGGTCLLINVCCYGYYYLVTNLRSLSRHDGYVGSAQTGICEITLYIVSARIFLLLHFVSCAK